MTSSQESPFAPCGLSTPHPHGSLSEFIASILDSNYKLLVSCDYDLVKYLCTQLLFADTTQSHYALHVLKTLYSHPEISREARDYIQKLFRWSAEHLAFYWNLFKNYEDASANRNQLQYHYSFPDTASFLIKECSACFLWLLSLDVLQAHGFNSAGQSYFSLAFCEGNWEIAYELILKMKPEEIILPSALLAGIPQDTVIQLSVMHQKFFIACWDKIEGILALELDKILSYTHCIYICRFTDEDLAERMRRRRIDLSSAVRKYPEVSWLEIARHNPDPSSFFNWLHREELWPPSSEIHSGSPLLIAAQNDRLPATTWLLYKTFDVRERWECAIGAATRHTAGSTSILECAIKRIALHSAVHPVRWPQNIYSAVIQGASQGAKKNTPEENTVIQHIAIKKMQFLRGHLGYSLLCSKKDMSLLKELDLQEMATFAENQNIIAKAEYEDQKKSLLKQHARLLKDFALKPRRTSTPQ